MYVTLSIQAIVCVRQYTILMLGLFGTGRTTQIKANREMNPIIMKMFKGSQL